MNYEGIEITKIAHDCFKVKKGIVIYIDPFQLSDNEEKADIILITHEHFDHCSIADIKKIIKDSTKLVAINECLSKLNQFENNNLKIVKPGSKLAINDIGIEAVPAYNIDKFRSPNITFHPKEDGHVGYILTINGKRIYHTGDSDVIPEMKEIKNIGIMLVPVSGTYVMTWKEAANAVRIIKPKIAIPMHYSTVVGSEKDAEKFKQEASEITKVEIL